MPGPRLLTTEFDGSATASEVVAGHDLSGLRAVVTGGAGGIGLATTWALASAGADVTMAVRALDAGRTAAAAVDADVPGPVRAVHLDLADLGSVARFVAAWEGPLHLLVNNAGVVTSGLERTREGWELQFVVNYLGHFALTTGLHDALRRGSAERDGSRIVNLSSTALMRADVDWTTRTSGPGRTTRRSPMPGPRPPPP
ncbi:SDR family NAD(P)-dependent oxidoreductase [Phycicoccus sp. BSK3Z-2]|uniref:SDR family NAD(P)-dependent oxidoreductase n=1 Tax=Phycicoccus avicenniae TaxID=2828860 RepID=A0A941D8H5_9MICO|nr:SDR family NAD(P)-dependent oxidoreductase [Phycicoccus avicenniae]MBR7741852.1 SDR family NAD(P)-dependent oxidoreductase [Phycicoccus avicenniae]